MGQVIVGTVLGAILGGLIGSIPGYGDANFQLAFPVQGGNFQNTVSLAKVLHCLSIIIGVSAGGIIGAFAGATAANPHTRPIPLWFWIGLASLVFLVLIAGALLFLVKSSPGPRRQGPDDQRPAPNVRPQDKAHQQENPPEKGQPKDPEPKR